MEAQRAEQLQEQVAALSTTKAAKEETINTIKAVGKHAVDFVTGKTKAREKAAGEQIEYLTEQVITAREIGQQEGKKSTLQAIAQAARMRFVDLTPENIGRSLAQWFTKAKRLEQEVRELKEATEAQNKAVQELISKREVEMYRRGKNEAQTQIKELKEDVAELIREYAHGDPDVILHYSTPREDRLFLSPKEMERQEAERKKREQEGKKKAPQVTEAPKQERQEEQKRSWGFRR